MPKESCSPPSGRVRSDTCQRARIPRHRSQLVRCAGAQVIISLERSRDVRRVQFRVIWEMEIEAASPKEAAREARAVQLTPGSSASVFDVWAHAAGKMHRIDLSEESDRLDREELFAVRAGLRLLQCKPDVPPSIQELTTILLIFLDRDNKIFERVHRGSSS